MRYVWIGLAVLAGIVAIVVVIGYSLPVRHRATSELSVRSTPDSLYALLTDLQGFPLWRTGLRAVELVPEGDGRTRYREISSDGTITYVRETADAPRRIINRIDDKTLPFGGTWTYDIIPGPDGRTTLRITEDGEVYNPIFRFVSRFVMGHDTTIRRFLADVSKRLPG